jgi:hypothetical protein
MSFALTFLGGKFLAILGVKLLNEDIPSAFEILNGYLSLFRKLKWKKQNNIHEQPFSN